MNQHFIHPFRYLFLLLSATAFDLSIQAQQLKKFSSRQYGVNEGLLQGHVVDITEDRMGFLWISTGTGLQRFNGTAFENILPQQGLPETDHPHFFKRNNGSIWLSYHKGISAYDPVTNKFTAVLQNDTGLLNQYNKDVEYNIAPVSPLIEIGEHIWCWSSIEKKCIAVNSHSFKIEKEFHFPDGRLPQFIYYQQVQTQGNNVFLNMNNGELVEVDLEKKTSNVVFNKPINVFQYIVYSNKILLLTLDGIFQEDMNSRQIKLLSPYPIPSRRLANLSLTHVKDSIFVLSVNNQLYLFNASSGALTYRMVNQQNEPFVYPGYISGCMMDHASHLWVISMAEGLKKINFNNLSIRYYGTGEPGSNFNRCIYPDKKNNLIITGSLFNGFSLYDSMQRLIKHFALKHEEQTSDILKLSDHTYLLITNRNNSTYLLDSRLLSLIPLNIEGIREQLKTNPVLYNSYIQKLTDTSALLFFYPSILKINYSGNHITLTDSITVNTFFTASRLDHSGRLWLAGTGVYYLFSGTHFEHSQKFFLPENVVCKYLFEDSSGNMWLGTEKGLYKINEQDGSVTATYNKANGMADECVYAIIEDNKHNIWFSSNRGISCLQQNNMISNLYEWDGLQGSEFNTNSIARAADGELFFGGINGVNSFFPDEIKNTEDKPGLVLTNIKVMDEDWHTDTAFWQIKHITLPYNENALSFSFTALGWYDPQVYIYQYQMKGVDDHIVQAGNNGYARYVLPPGEYVFEYAVTNSLHQNILQRNRLLISIVPPFWKTAWFKGLLIIGIMGILILILYLYNGYRDKKRLQQIMLQQSLQEERERISRDLHDNIGAYSTLLINNSEKLKQQTTDTRLDDIADHILSDARGILASLQGTIWVLNNESLTVIDFADRIKSYAKKFNRNNTGIRLHFQEDIQQNIILSPAEALHIFRIVQEVLQNAVKHAMAGNISISVKSGEKLSITVKDDGKGYSQNKIIEGNGLSNIRYRANAAGYELDINSNGNGTCVNIHRAINKQI
ncbi:MAG: two-component regulator propeller domain-containing protein [Ferruginibacter sp.]